MKSNNSSGSSSSNSNSIRSSSSHICSSSIKLSSDVKCYCFLDTMKILFLGHKLERLAWTPVHQLSGIKLN